MSTNPLLNTSHLPDFNVIKPEHVGPAIDSVLAENRAAVAELLEHKTHTWESLVTRLEQLDEKLQQAWSPVSHMNSVVNNDELRQAYNACLPKLSEYGTELSQNPKLYQAFLNLKENPDFKNYDKAQQQVINNHLRDFHLAGVDLPADKKQLVAELEKDLSQLSNQFEEHVLDASNAWQQLVTDKAELNGLPEHAVKMLHEQARTKEEEGYLLTLEFPCYLAVITYAKSRALREEIYTAFATRASDQGPNAGQWDNTEVMNKILDKRQQLAEILGFNNFAELSLATKMAESPETVLEFIDDLAKRAKPQAEAEIQTLKDYASNDGITELKPWDLAYYSEQLKQEKFAVSDEMLRPYFPADKVLTGMFSIIEKLYGVNLKETDNDNTWHKDVRFFSIFNKDKKLIGEFYLDLYARQRKRHGAWMDECRTRRLVNDKVETPVAYLTCNFTPPQQDTPALLTHDEVLTLFHETGHGLHHLLTRIDYADVAGINGVAWDAVELPSQFFEYWCWQKEALPLISGHYKTGEALPDDLYEKLYAAKNFQAAMAMLRQLEFSLFDFRIHMEKDAEVSKILNEVRAQLSVVPTVAFNRFQHSFSHIFGGGYAAGYYSYKWAEVLAADAFAAFEEEGVFSAECGQRFLDTLLSQGGSQDAMDLFVAFRGRKPQIDALLRHTGLTSA